MSRLQANQGLLVAWGGLTKPAEQIVTQNYFHVRAWSANDLMQAVFRTYDRLSEDIRTELPLKRVWALVEEPGLGPHRGTRHEQPLRPRAGRPHSPHP